MKMFISKTGIEYGLLSALLQFMIFSPVFLLCSFLITSIVLSFCDFETMTVFWIAFCLFHIVLFARNRAVKITDNCVLIRDLIGKKQNILFSDIISYEILSVDDFRTLIRKSSSADPIKTNNFSLLLPVKNAVLMKSKYNRNILICVWNSEKFIAALKSHINNDEKETNNYNFKITHSNKADKYVFYLKMPIEQHIVTYFNKCTETILLPLSYSLLAYFLFKISDTAINICWFIVMFVIISIAYYYKTMRIVVYGDKKIIRLNVFNDNNKNVIHYSNIKNINVSNWESIDYTLSQSDAILTPHYNDSNNIITFELDCNIYVLISLNDAVKLSEILMD